MALSPLEMLTLWLLVLLASIAITKAINVILAYEHRTHFQGSASKYQRGWIESNATDISSVI